MNEPSEEVKAMARRIASQFAETSENIDYEVHIAIAAILETQRRDAELVERMAQATTCSAKSISTQIIGGLQDWSLSFDERQMCSNLATAVRTGTHYGKAEQ